MKFAIAILSIFLIFHAQIEYSVSKDILFYFGVTGYSHLSGIWPLIELLSTNGHNVTELTSFQPKTNKGSKVNVVYVHEIFEMLSKEWDEDADLVQARINGEHLQIAGNMFRNGYESCKIMLQSPATHNLEASICACIVYNSHFDLVVIDATFNDCGILLAKYQYKAPFIFYSPFPCAPTVYDDFGIPLETSSIPDLLIGKPLTFMERLRSTLSVFSWTYDKRTNLLNPLAEMAQKELKLDHLPSIPDLLKETSLYLMNVHYTTEFARSLPPLFVQVAGIHINDNRKPIPKEIEEFISKPGPGSNAFVYISFGTAVRISKSKPEIRQKFFNAIGNLTDLRFVWKWEGDNFPPAGAPPNIYFAKWMPQQDILAHKAIKGFIGHGGISGVHEAVYFGVPAIIIPLFVDQDYNAFALKTKGLSTVLEIGEFTQANLESTIQNLVNNSTLKKNVAEASKVFKDRPMKPIDTALWWIEYVLRHPKTPYLMAPAIHQSIIVRRQLDVWFTIFAVFVLSIITVGFVLYKLVKMFQSDTTNIKLKTG